MASLALNFKNKNNKSTTSQKSSTTAKKRSSGTGIPRRKLSSGSTSTTTSRNTSSINKFKLKKSTSNGSSGNKSIANNSNRKRLKKSNSAGQPREQAQKTEEKKAVVFNIDKRARRINNARMFTKGIKAFRGKHPFQPKVLKEEKENATDLSLHRVFVRPRPLFENEADRGEFDAVSCVENGICVHEGTQKMSFRKGEVKVLRNHIFQNVTPVTSNDNMFENIKYLIDRVKEGKHSSIFMFGMTGSGKTYNTNIIHERAPINFFQTSDCNSTIANNSSNTTILSTGEKGNNNINDDGKAKSPQKMMMIINEEPNTYINVVAYELVGNKCYDLLSEKKGEVFLRVGKDKNTHVCENVTKTATTAGELQDILKQASLNRETDATGANATSSRSHAVYEIHYKKNDGKLLLIDLAGNEGNIETMHHTKEQMQQAALINQSLSTLKACLKNIAVGTKHIPFREAALTRVLKSSLTSPTCATAVLACVSPACTHFELTMGTMKSSVKLLGEVKKPIVEEHEMHVEGIKKGGPKNWDRQALLQWFQKQNFGCKLDVPAGMNGAAIMKLNLIRLNQCCKTKKGQLISRQKAQVIFDALREAARNARKKDLAIRQRLLNEKNKVMSTVDFAKKARRNPTVASASRR